MNSLLTGGALVALGGSVPTFKDIPVKIQEYFNRHFTSYVVITDDTHGFKWLKAWIFDSDLFKTKRRLDLHTPYINGKPQIFYSLSPGTHYFMFKNKICSITFDRKEDKVGGYDKRTESFVLKTYSRNKEILKQFILDARKSYEILHKDPKLYFWYKDFWKETIRKTRKLDTIVLPDGVKESILNDMKFFIDSDSKYESKGVPYHRGYLFKGPPGMGKTALTTALANELGLSIYFVKLNEFNDKSLMESFRQINSNSIILMEDVDCVVPQRNTKSEIDLKTDQLFGVTLSGLLNVLDGLPAPSGVFYIMTTNDVSRIDSALLRPGRIDVQVDFNFTGKNEAVKLYRKFFPDDSLEESEKFVENINANNLAEYQEHFMKKLVEINKI